MRHLLPEHVSCIGWPRWATLNEKALHRFFTKEIICEVWLNFWSTRRGAFTSVADDKILALSKFKAFADDKLNFTFFPNDQFKIFQTEWISRWQFQSWWKLQDVLKKGRKHYGKMRNLLLMSNFSFSHSVVKRLVLQTRKNQEFVWEMVKTLNLSFMGVKTLWEKEKMLVTSIFSFSRNVLKGFIPRGLKSCHCMIKD